jgi:hypothetical protein
MEENVRESMNGRRSKDEIQSHIEATQEELRHTLEAISESISPGEMIDTVFHALRIGPGEFAANLGRSVRENPVAIGLVGAGLAWLMLGTSTKESIRERAGETGHRLKERAGETGHQLRGQAEKVRAKAGELRGKVEGAAQEAGGEAAGGARSVADASREKKDQAVESARRGARRARGMASDQPLVVAAVGLIAGLTAAAMVPRSRTEDRLLGERAEHMAETAEDAARGVAEGVREGFEAHDEPRGDSGTGEPNISDPSTGER